MSIGFIRRGRVVLGREKETREAVGGGREGWNVEQWSSEGCERDLKEFL